MLGESEVPAEAYWGIHTQRAMKNFAVSAFRVPGEMITALAEVKEACALANMRDGLLEGRTGEAIAQAAKEVASGALGDQFVVDAFEGGVLWLPRGHHQVLGPLPLPLQEGDVVHDRSSSDL